jgi:uncharacterized protein YbaP (TraB family)
VITGRLLAATLAFLLASCGSDVSEPSAAASAEGLPAFYEIAGQDGELEGWLFGTVHALPPDVEWRSQRLDTIIDEADLLLVEVADLSDREGMALIFRSMAFDDVPASSIRARIAPVARPYLDMLLAEGGIPTGHLDAMESWAAALTLAQLASTGDPQYGADRALISEFAGRRVVEFEGVRGQLSLFDSLPETEQVDLIEAVIAEASGRKNRASEMTVAWKTGDLPALEKSSGEGLLGDPELRKALLKSRNEAWVSRLLPMLDRRERPLIAVGAAHLLGDDGLPALLAGEGYTVRRVQ